MDCPINFVLELANGSEVVQEFTIPAEKVQGAINQLIATFMQLGYIKKEKGDTIICHRVNKVSVNIPSIVLAGANEIPKGNIQL